MEADGSGSQDGKFLTQEKRQQGEHQLEHDDNLVYSPPNRESATDQGEESTAIVMTKKTVRRRGKSPKDTERKQLESQRRSHGYNS